MDSGSLPVVRIADDGELDDVRLLIEQLGIEWVAEDAAQDRPTALWIGSAARLVVAGTSSAQAAFRIVVADKLTNMLQRQIERQRPDFLVKRPFHPAALRLLILHALYQGPERRSSARLAMSTTIRFRSGVFSRAATLVELSRGGCRLVARRLPALGESVTVILPRGLTGNGDLSLAGRVVAFDHAGGFEPAEQACSIAFDATNASASLSLRNLLTLRAEGCAPPVLRTVQRASISGAPTPSGAAAAKRSAPRPAVTVAAPQAPAAGGRERRRSTRRAYHRPVLAAGSGATRVLIGRDLSSGGMRVAADAYLIVGDEHKLVLYGPAGRPPLVIRALVLRNDGGEGCVLQFGNLAPKIVAELAEWTTQLPNLGDKAGADGAAVHSIVSEIIEEPEGSD